MAEEKARIGVVQVSEFETDGWPREAATYLAGLVNAAPLLFALVTLADGVVKVLEAERESTEGGVEDKGDGWRALEAYLARRKELGQ